MKGTAIVIGLAGIVALAACGKKDERASTQAPPAAKAGAVEPAPAETATPAPQQQQPVTVSAVVSHEVEDFDEWKQVFDAHSAARKQAGAVWHSVSRDVDNPSKVYIHLVGTDEAKLRALMGSEDLAKTMVAAGVKGVPDVWLAGDVVVEPQAGKIQAETFSVFLRLEVEDFGKWLAVYDAGGDRRKNDLGVLRSRASRFVDQPDTVVLHFVVADPDKLAGAMSSEQMQQTLRESGVKGAPELLVARDVETSAY